MGETSCDPAGSRRRERAVTRGNKTNKDASLTLVVGMFGVWDWPGLMQAGTPAVPGKNAAGSGRVASVWALHRSQARHLRTALCARNAPPSPCRLVNPLSLQRLAAQRGLRALPSATCLSCDQHLRAQGKSLQRFIDESMRFILQRPAAQRSLVLPKANLRCGNPAPARAERFPCGSRPDQLSCDRQACAQKSLLTRAN